MKAIIMAGGFGTRLRPVTGDKPKPMADMLGAPIMEHIVKLLRDKGYRDICAALKYRAGDIIAHFGDGSEFGVRMQYRIEEEPLGTAGAVKNCADFYGEEDFLVISADAACDFELGLLMEEHKKRSAALTIALQRDKAPLRYGLALTESGGRILSFIEKPGWEQVVTDLVNTGIYVISPRVMELVPDGRAFDFGAELFPELLRRGEKLIGLEMQGYWRDIGTPLSYYKCCVDAIEGRLKIKVPEEYRAGGTVNAPVAETGKAAKKTPGELEETVACKDRAGLMHRLSDELLELMPDYSHGISLKGENCEIRISPSPDICALRIAVKSHDAEFAEHMLGLAKKAVEEAEGSVG